MKNTIKNTINRVFVSALAFALVCTVSCTSNYGELNTDPYSATPKHMETDFLQYGSLILQMQRNLIPTIEEDANQFQRAQNLVGDTYGGYMSPTGEFGQGNNGSNYVLPYADWCDTAFEVAYSSIMPSWITLSELTEMNSDEAIIDMHDAVRAVGDIIKVGAMHRITDIYGPIPYESFGKKDEGFTRYDSQKSIYLQFFEELDNAIAVLGAFSEPVILPKYDLYFGGNVSRWLKYANSLKLRLAIRLAYVSDGEFEGKKPAEYAAEAIAAGVLTSNDDNVAIKSLGSVRVLNPLEVVWNGYEDTRMNASMDSYLNGYNDLRASAYFQPATYPGAPTNTYAGVRCGITITSDSSDFLTMSAPNVDAADPVKVMSAAECYFLRAEAALRGWTTENAQEMYEEGIATSFREWGVTPPSSYLADDTSKPADFEDKSGMNTGGISARGTITIAWKDGDSDALKLERIITQKWIAGFPEGQEAWSEFRRTGYPKIFPIVDNRSNGVINSETQIRRLVYPVPEMNQNPLGVATGIAALGGGLNNGATKLWWDAK